MKSKKVTVFRKRILENDLRIYVVKNILVVVKLRVVFRGGGGGAGGYPTSDSASPTRRYKHATLPPMRGIQTRLVSSTITTFGGTS